MNSESPVTIILNCLFNYITEVEPINTTYEAVSNQKIESTGPIQATVKTNQETIHSPLPIPKAITSLLNGLDRMQQL